MSVCLFRKSAMQLVKIQRDVYFILSFFYPISSDMLISSSEMRGVYFVLSFFYPISSDMLISSSEITSVALL
jgi:hypothetical protein